METGNINVATFQYNNHAMMRLKIILLICCSLNMSFLGVKGMVDHFGKQAYSFSCRELDEKIDLTLMSVATVNRKWEPAAS